MSTRKSQKYNIEYRYATGKDALDFGKILSRLFKKFLVSYESSK